MAVTRERFEELVAEALDEIPEPFLEMMENVQVIVEDEPTPGLLRSLGLHPRRDTLFGLYDGVPLDERGDNHAMTLPDRITLYYRPLVRACRSERALRREIATTVVHEVAHFFGLDEDDVWEEGY